MAIEYKEAIIESKTKPTTARKGLKISGKWMAIGTNAEKFFDSVNYNDKCKIGIENDTIVYIQKLNTTPNTPSTPNNRNEFNDRINKIACFKMATAIIAHRQIVGNNPEKEYAQIIRVYAQALFDEMNNFIKSETTETGIQIPIEDIK